MAKQLPDSLRRMAVTRRAELDFTLPERADLPEDLLKRFPSLKAWAEAEAHRVRMLEQTVRELVTAVREDIEEPAASTEETVVEDKGVHWSTIIGKPECFPPCTTPADEDTTFEVTVNGV